MKRILSALTAIVLACNVNSQTIFEGLKTSQNDILGSARYMGVAGAFGALGGDVSAIKDNPAGLGIFRKSELTTTLDLQMQSTNAQWGKIKSSDGQYSVGMNNLTLVLVGKTWRAESGYAGLVNSNFSFSYNKLKNFNRNIYVKNELVKHTMTDYFAYMSGGIKDPALYKYDDNYVSENDLNRMYDDDQFSWLGIMGAYAKLIKPVYNGTNVDRWTSTLLMDEEISPEYTLHETGGVNEYSFGWSGNFSNRIFIGLTANIQSIEYQMNSTFKEVHTAGNMSLKNYLSTSGSGFNVNVGAIAVPVDFIRIGFAIHTPTFYNINQTNSGGLSFENDYRGETNTYDYPNKYILQTPLQLNLSTAFILDKKGFISAEYVYNNYKGMKFLSVDGYGFTEENQDIKSMLENARTIKVGGEYRLTDNFSLRAGYANSSNSTNSTATKNLPLNTVRTDPEFFRHNSTNYTTLGFGYRENNWYFDVAYVNRMINEDYFSYNSNGLNAEYQVTPANIKTSNNSIVTTFGIRF